MIDPAIQQLLDKQAIHELVLRYARGVDRRDYGALRELYTADAVEDDHAGQFTGSASAYIDWLEQAMPAMAMTDHYIVNHLIDLQGEHEAQGEVYAINYHRIAGGGVGGGETGGAPRSRIHGSRYLDHYLKQNGLWLFRRRSVVLDWMEQGDTHWPAAEIAGKPLGQPGTDDLSYAKLSSPLFVRGDALPKRFTSRPGA